MIHCPDLQICPLSSIAIRIHVWPWQLVTLSETVAAGAVMTKGKRGWQQRGTNFEEREDKRNLVVAI